MTKPIEITNVIMMAYKPDPNSDDVICNLHSDGEQGYEYFSIILSYGVRTICAQHGVDAEEVIRCIRKGLSEENVEHKIQ